MGERPGKHDPFLGQSIDMGSFDVILAVTANPVRSQGIYSDEQNIVRGGMFRSLFGEHRGGHEQNKECQAHPSHK
jgi:hypothetical protein